MLIGPCAPTVSATPRTGRVTRLRAKISRRCREFLAPRDKSHFSPQPLLPSWPCRSSAFAYLDRSTVARSGRIDSARRGEEKRKATREISAWGFLRPSPAPPGGATTQTITASGAKLPANFRLYSRLAPGAPMPPPRHPSGLRPSPVTDAPRDEELLWSSWPLRKTVSPRGLWAAARSPANLCDSPGTARRARPTRPMLCRRSEASCDLLRRRFHGRAAASIPAGSSCPHLSLRGAR